MKKRLKILHMCEGKKKGERGRVDVELISSPPYIGGEMNGGPFPLESELKPRVSLVVDGPEYRVTAILERTDSRYLVEVDTVGRVWVLATTLIETNFMMCRFTKAEIAKACKELERKE